MLRISAQSDSCYRFLVTINMFPCFYYMTIIVINANIYHVFLILDFFPDILVLARKKMTQ